MRSSPVCRRASASPSGRRRPGRPRPRALSSHPRPAPTLGRSTRTRTGTTDPCFWSENTHTLCPRTRIRKGREKKSEERRGVVVRKQSQRHGYGATQGRKADLCRWHAPCTQNTSAFSSPSRTNRATAGGGGDVVASTHNTPRGQSDNRSDLPHEPHPRGIRETSCLTVCTCHERS